MAIGPRTLLRRCAVLLAALLLAGCTSTARTVGAPPADPAVVVASFNFDESALVAEIYAQALEQAGIPVRRQLRLGPRELVRPALREGLVDLVPEYLGSALVAMRSADQADPATVPGVDLGNRPAVLGALRAALAPWRLAVLQPAPAGDQNAFAVTRATARQYRLRTLTDLAAVAGGLVLGGPAECPRRPYCLLGLQRVYGMRVGRFVALDDADQRSAALAEGLVDIAVTFTTSGQLATGSAVALVDDRHLQPVESVTPVLSERATRRYGARLTGTLDAVSAALDQHGLSFLNWRVSVAGKDIATEAHDWLLRHPVPATAR